MVLFNVSYQRIGIMMAERREEENSLQQERDVKLIARLLQLGVSESEIRETFEKGMLPRDISQETFEKMERNCQTWL
jgi:Na+-transporting NADH:ubiquinone oxidoreductase subunit NqrC